MKKARLIITYDCPKNCEGCCNKNWKYTSAVKITSVKSLIDYDEINITGGEPMLLGWGLLDLIFELINQNDTQTLYLYTALADDKTILLYKVLVKILTGITFTIHNEEDIDNFIKLNNMLLKMNPELSLQLHVFDNLLLKFPMIDLSLWKVKSMVWIKDCPLPKDETLYELK